MFEIYPVPELTGLPQAAAWLEKRVRALPGVKNAVCRPSTGRLQVQWERSRPKNFSPEKLLEGFSLAEAYGFLPAYTPLVEKEKPWHSLPVRRVLLDLGVNPLAGLDEARATRSRKRAGANRIAPIPAKSAGEILLRQVQEPSNVLLGTSAGASMLTGGMLEAGAILGVIGLNGGIGFATESQAERALKNLSSLGPEETLVLREGVHKKLPASEVVKGDILILKAGMPVVADARVISCSGLTIDESILTGESQPLAKTTRSVARAQAVAERTNMVYRGGFVLSGEGRAVVIATGERTQAGRIQNSLARRFQQTGMQRRLDQLNRELIDLSLSSTAALFTLGMLMGQPWLKLLRTSISMAVATVPEGLPTVSTLTHSRAVARLLRHKVLVRDLQSVETLGSIQTLCLDKTGTITENQMRVVRVAIPGEPELIPAPLAIRRKNQSFRALVECAELCNDANARGKSGSPTERALLEFARKSDRRRRRAIRTSTSYRDDVRRYMTTGHRTPGGREMEMMKGDPEQVLSLCSSARVKNKMVDIRLLAGAIARQNKEMSDSALRVLGFASRKRNGQWEWLGLLGLQDPPRPKLKKTLARFHQAGIRTVMITGDQAPTAVALARELKLSNGEKLVTVDLKNGCPPPEELARLAAGAHIFARVTPENKRNIIEAIRSQGRIVGMVGDGINDAPALRAAHVGIAIGASGTEAAREVASVVLLDDDLSRLLEAVSLGRTAAESLRKSVRYLVSTNVSEMAVVMGETALDLKEVMDPLQLLWINLVNDTVPALALALDKPRSDILQSPTPDPRRKLLPREELGTIGREAGLFSSLTMAALLFGHLRGLSTKENQTMAMHALTLSQTLHALSCHSDKKVALKELLRSHKPLLLASLGTLSLHLGVMSNPLARKIFRIKALSSIDLMLSTVLPLTGFWIVENEKAKRLAAA